MYNEYRDYIMNFHAERISSLSGNEITLDQGRNLILEAYVLWDHGTIDEAGEYVEKAVSQKYQEI